MKVWIYNRNRKKRKGGEGQMKREQSSSVLKSHSFSDEGGVFSLISVKGEERSLSRQGSSELREISHSDLVFCIGYTTASAN